MHPGLDPRTRLLRWSLFLATLAILIMGTGGQALDAVTGWLRDEYDRLPWYATRVTGLLAYLALTGSVVYGLLLSTKILDAIAHRTVSFTLHQDLASIGLGLAGVHAALLTLDRSVPFSPAEILIPFSGPYRPVWVGLGQVALGLSLVIVISFYVRRRIGQKTWRKLHYLSFVAFIGASAHGLMSGSDTQTKWAFWGYLLAVAAVVFLTTYRITMALVARPMPSAAAPAAAPTQPEPTPGSSGAKGALTT